MSSSDDGGTDRNLSSGSGEGEPGKSFKKRKITATSQQTAVPVLEGWGSVSTNDDHGGRVGNLKEEDALWLKNNHNFFPERVWRKVMEKLKTKADIENCSNASPFFGYLLREKREREVVLPTAFGILAKLYEDKQNKDKLCKERNVDSIPWQIPAQRKRPHRMTGIWKCRLVSKKWNHAIEEIHQNEDAGHYKMDWNGCSHVSGASSLSTEIFLEESEVVKFLGHFESTHNSAVRQMSKKNPFLGRFVDVVYDVTEVETNQAYFNKLLELFEKFGGQVFYFMFNRDPHDSVNELVYIYRKLKQMVELMPNLKVLRIRYIAFPSKEELLALEEEIERNPFPELANWEMISVYGIPGKLCNHLVHQNRQIKRLEINTVRFNGNCSVFTEQLANLKQLSLMEVYSDFEALETSPATFNLEKFQFSCSMSHQLWPWARYFYGIGSKVSCTELRLHLPMPRSEAERMSVLQDSLECRMKLANVQRCHVCCSARFFLDFLLESRNTLRQLEIDISWQPAFEIAEQKELVDKQVIKFLGFEDKMELSNIGKELPRLRKLQVVRVIGGRGGLRLRRHYNIESNGLVKFEKEERW